MRDKSLFYRAPETETRKQRRPGMRGPTDRIPGQRQGEGNDFCKTCHMVRRARRKSGYSQYCHCPVNSTYADNIALVTECANMQSAMFRVRTAHQLYKMPAASPTSQYGPCSDANSAATTQNAIGAYVPNGMRSNSGLISQRIS